MLENHTHLPSLVAPKLAHYFNLYALSHQTIGNQRCHAIGIPLIVMSLFGILAQWSLPALQWGEYVRLDGATGLISLVTLWYLTLDWKLAGPAFLVGVGFYFLGRAIPLTGNVGLLVIGWVFQVMGHRVYEKKRPAFMDHALHLFIAPLWLFGKVVGYR